jgi:hypothetical protein
MNQDYLWDKTGECDPEIERLEEILAPLRYQPKPLAIPKDLKLKRQRSYLPLLAIAATIAMVLLAAGIWLKLKRQETIDEVKITVPGVELVPLRLPVEKQKVGISERAEYRRHRRQTRNSEVAQRIKAKERKEAEAAKQQIMLALRLASVKMNIARKGAQGTPNIIRNQHKAG